MKEQLQRRRGNVYLVYGPPRSGKTELVRAVLGDKRFKELTHVLRCTTRQPRRGETDGREFFFVREEAFQESLQTGWFVTCQEVGGVRYGLPYIEIEACIREGSDVLVEATTGCAAELLANPKIHSDIRSIFVQPTLAVLAASQGTEFEPEIVSASLSVLPMSGHHDVVVNELFKEDPNDKSGAKKKNPGVEALKKVLLGYRPEWDFRVPGHPASMNQIERAIALKELSAAA